MLIIRGQHLRHQKGEIKLGKKQYFWKLGKGSKIYRDLQGNDFKIGDVAVVKSQKNSRNPRNNKARILITGIYSMGGKVDLPHGIKASELNNVLAVLPIHAQEFLSKATV